MRRAAHVHREASPDEEVEAAEDMLLATTPLLVSPADMAKRYGVLEGDVGRLTILFESLPLERLSAGARVLTEGEPADGLLLLEEGRVTVLHKGEGGSAPQRVRAMAAGAILGDIGHATGTKRTADIVAETTVLVRRISAATIAMLERDESAVAMALARLVMRALAEKVVTANRVAEDQSG